MCRLTAYLGPVIPLERIIVNPIHSLLEQSQNATEAKLSVNGDGFGVAWYNEDGEAGVYRDVLPAWSDGNLPDLCRMIRSNLFLAHVRASTIGQTSRTNCHPFRFENWTFVHNGQIGGFKHIERKLESSLPDNLYDQRHGKTDSELFFLIMIKNGLMDDPYTAVQKTIHQIKDLQGILVDPNRITCAFSDAKNVYGFRYSSDGRSPSLYLGETLESGGSVLASERLDNNKDRWRKLSDLEFVTLSAEGTHSRALVL